MYRRLVNEGVVGVGLLESIMDDETTTSTSPKTRKRNINNNNNNKRLKTNGDEEDEEEECGDVEVWDSLSRSFKQQCLADFRDQRQHLQNRLDLLRFVAQLRRHGQSTPPKEDDDDEDEQQQQRTRRELRELEEMMCLAAVGLLNLPYLPYKRVSLSTQDSMKCYSTKSGIVLGGKVVLDCRLVEAVDLGSSCTDGGAEQVAERSHKELEDSQVLRAEALLCFRPLFELLSDAQYALLLRQVTR
ncbi:hypothetical protein Q3G72_025537 [Acer saccharum]|nr:hypothetical protein Q3G72_025537 [Acer saccharum]